jgi:hypothetical protein
MMCDYRLAQGLERTWYRPSCCSGNGNMVDGKLLDMSSNACCHSVMYLLLADISVIIFCNACATGSPFHWVIILCS